MLSLLSAFIIGAFAFLNIKIKQKSLINILLISAISLFFILNRGNHDYDGYVIIFENPDIYAERGYALLVNAIKLQGGTHNHILLILGFFIFFTLYRYSKISNYFSLALLCYFIFPMPSDIIQIRNTFLMLFLMNAIHAYIKEKYLLTFTLLTIGTSFHSLGLIYLIIFIIMVVKNLKIIHNHYYAFITILAIFAYGFFLPMISTALSGESSRNLSSYISDNTKIHSLIIWGGNIIIDLIIIQFFLNRLVQSTIHINYIYAIKSIIVASLIFSAGLLYIDEFNRLFRNLFLLKYLLFVSIIPLLRKKHQLFLATYMLVSASAFGLYYSYGLDSDYILFNIK